MSTLRIEPRIPTSASFWLVFSAGWHARSRRTTFWRAKIMARTKRTDRRPARSFVYSLVHQLPDHPHKARMCARGAGAEKMQPEGLGFVPGLFIKIVKYFEVVGNESDGHHYHVSTAVAPPCPLFGNFPQRFPDIRPEPRLRGRSAAALIGELPVGMAERFGNQARRFTKLGLVLAVLSHCQRNAVRSEDQMRRRASLTRNFSQRLARPLDHWLNETGMIEKRP